MTITRRGHLRRDGVIDVSVDVFRTDAVEDTVAGEHVVDGWLKLASPGSARPRAPAD